MRTQLPAILDGIAPIQRLSEVVAEASGLRQALRLGRELRHKRIGVDRPEGTDSIRA